ncbi:MAG TPA: hypothetical protein VLM39_05325, partial [Ignavibacteriaceae bacterium]|nr:hypothetical protein [Ignavibacteriaceae bacterium]
VLIKNVGGDLNLTHGQNPENQEALFLDGIRFNNQIFQVGLRIEPVRDFIFDIIYDYDKEENISEGSSRNQSYGMIKFTLNY